jgi:hypothetical protein
VVLEDAHLETVKWGKGFGILNVDDHANLLKKTGRDFSTARDRFYKTPFRPKNLLMNFSPQILDKFPPLFFLCGPPRPRRLAHYYGPLTISPELRKEDTLFTPKNKSKTFSAHQK